MATGYTSGDPHKIDRAGDTMTGPLISPDGSPYASETYVADHSGGGGGTPLLIADSGPITSGNITCDTTAWSLIGPPLTIPAAVGDILQLHMEALIAPSGGAILIVDAATQVGGADTSWWSSGTSVPLYPGTRPGWYVDLGRYIGPESPTRYRVQPGDVDGGQVTVQVYGRGDSGARDVLASAAFPARIWLDNVGSGS